MSSGEPWTVEEGMAALEDVLAGCVTKCSKERILSGDKVENSRFRYLLAGAVSGFVDEFLFGLEEAYVFGSTNDDCASRFSDVDLLFVVGEKREGCYDKVSWLDSRVCGLLRERYCLDFGDSLLDVAEARSGVGFASHISTVYYRPALRVFPR